MVNNVIRTNHEVLGHMGTGKVLEYIKQVYWFPQMKLKIKNFIENCLICIVYSPKYGKKEGLLHSIEKGSKPFDTIHIDHLGPLERSKQFYRHILVVVDVFTKFVRLYPCKSTTSRETIRHLEDYFRCYSVPKRVISDRGTCFSSSEFRQFTESFDIQLVLIATGVPMANGQVEVVNRSLTPMLAKLSSGTDTWDKVLHQAEFAFNNTVNSSTRKTPSELLFGIPQNGRVNDRLRDMLSTENGGKQEDLENLREEAAVNIQKQQEFSKRNYDKSHKEAVKYQEGDYFLITNTDTTVGTNKKLVPKYKGPYVVKRVLRHDRYVLEDPPDFQLTQIPYKGTVDASNMKLWIDSSKC